MAERSFRLLAEASAELDEALEWYVERNPHAAARFLTELEAALSVVAEWPLGSQRIEGYEAVHRCALRTYPFDVVYRVTERTIDVVAVAHHKRAPGYWRGR